MALLKGKHIFLALCILYMCMLILSTACSKGSEAQEHKLNDNNQYGNGYNRSVQRLPPESEQSNLKDDFFIDKEKIKVYIGDFVPKQNVRLLKKNIGGMNAEELADYICKLAFNIYSPPVDAYVESKDWSIKQGKFGRKLDEAKTIDLIKKAKPGDTIEPVVIQIKPLITSVQLKQKIKVIGYYRTFFHDFNKNRVNNIDIAADEIHGIIIKPGEEFSFNDALGQRSAEKGYKNAPIIIKTAEGSKKSIGIGGGICQVSTTLYNAALNAGLQIIEKHSHSKKVPYAPEGKDATVSYGEKDLKIKNNRLYPIMIKAYTGKKSITVEIVENRM